MEKVHLPVIQNSENDSENHEEKEYEEVWENEGCCGDCRECESYVDDDRCPNN